jgi:two-component system sensor histidine kinase RegB
MIKFKDESGRLRLQTLIRLRWLAVFGQSITVLFVAYGLQFPFPLAYCFVLIAASAWLNVILRLRYHSSYRLKQNAALMMLTYDVLQLSGLLYLTGGLENPFSLLLIVPVVISATAQSSTRTLILGVIVIISASLLGFFHLSLPWPNEEAVKVSFLYIIGVWFAILSSLAFTAIYVFRVANEARTLGNALAATELMLEREQHLSALDGLAAAAAHELGTPLGTIAVVSKEMLRELKKDSPLYEDAALLRSQAERCRDILQKLTSLSSEGEMHLARLPFTSLIEEVVAPHRDFGVKLDISHDDNDSAEPIGKRNSAIIYGLGNLVENAVDFANERVQILCKWDDRDISITIIDDGSGFSAEMLDRIGEPYISTRSRADNPKDSGLGLGLFIAKTLLERSGANLKFGNDYSRINDNLYLKPNGAKITIAWPRDSFEMLDLQQENLSDEQL